MCYVDFEVLKSALSEYLWFAAAGETLLIIDHDRVVAEIMPPRTGHKPSLPDAPLAEAVSEGWLTPPTLVEGPPPRKPIASFRDLTREVQHDRDGR